MFYGNTTLLKAFKPETVFYIAIIELALIFWIVFSGTLTAHRTAGPMVALKGALTRVGSGDLTTTVQFRKRDFNQNVTNSFNENIESLRQQVVVIKQLVEQLEQQIPDDENTQEVLEKLKQQLDSLQT